MMMRLWVQVVQQLLFGKVRESCVQPAADVNEMTPVSICCLFNFTLSHLQSGRVKDFKFNHSMHSGCILICSTLCESSQCPAERSCAFLPRGSYAGKGWCEWNKQFTRLNVALISLFRHLFNDGALGNARVETFQRWTSWAELRWHFPICVNEMTRPCPRVTVIFTAEAAEIHASPWRSLSPHLHSFQTFPFSTRSLFHHARCAPAWSTGSFALSPVYVAHVN